MNGMTKQQETVLQALLSYVPLAVILLTSIPMIFKMIPPNRTYGYRTAETLSSPEIWYAANFEMGLSLAITSIAAMFTATVIIKRLKARLERKIFLHIANLMFFVFLGIGVGS